MSTMRNLTLASAKHLMTAGHITPAHHAKIVASVKMPGMRKPKKPPGASFGSLMPQQAQAPIPGVAPPQAIPAGAATGYDEE